MNLFPKVRCVWGYFSLSELSDLDSDGVYWLTKVKSPCVVYVEDYRFDLISFLLAQRLSNIDQPILLGAKEKVKCRLIAQKVCPEVANSRRRKIRKNAKEKGKTPSKRQLQLALWSH